MFCGPAKLRKKYHDSGLSILIYIFLVKISGKPSRFQPKLMKNKNMTYNLMEKYFNRS